MSAPPKANELPQFLREMVSAPPRAGEGVHAWLFCVARQLHAHLPAGEIIALLESRVMECGRHVPRNEVVSAVQNSIPCAWKSGGNPAGLLVNKWPKVNSERRSVIIRNGGGLVDLWEASPIRLEDNAAHTEAIIDALFPSNPLLCVGRSSLEFGTERREHWRAQLAQMQFIVPSAMSARMGLTKEGKESVHTLSNTGARRFLVIEFDQGGVDEHAAVLLHLAASAPLALVVHSGSKSLHGWFYCAGQIQERLERFMRYVVSLGADKATWTRSQFVRMPDGTRANGKRQTVFFFNPEVVK
jgi:hypothetical protein